MSKNYIDDLIFPELRYQLVGCAFEVFNELGYGHSEKIYQRAMAVTFIKRKISHKEQVCFPLRYQGQVIGKGFCDFLVDEKIIIELKKSPHFSKANIDQVNQYPRTSGLKLAIIISFTPDGAVFKRIVNLN